ncbi:MAG TPA: hypothetical protein VFT01_03930 [Homoserinimonas sp.]|nr:hypothetical protein [Homoserinimonas sp.]
MTFTEILRSLLRRWYVMVGALVCIAVAILMVARVDGVYSVRVNLVFLPPPIATSDENTLRWSSESLVNFAAVIERSYNGNTPQPQFASIDAPIYGSGQTSGVKVFLPNTGGQWTSDFRDATLVVEAVDPNRDAVAKRLDAVIAELQALAAERQRTAGVDADHLISVLVSDEASGVRFVQGSTVRAAGSIVILGLAIGGVVAVLVDRALIRRRARGSRQPEPA